LKYRLATVYYVSGDSKRSDELLKNAIEELDKLLATTPDFAEALTLKGAAIGMRISFRPSIRGMTMGPASGRAISRALELDPANPRVWLIKGIAAHNTPALFGGGSKKALSALDQSIALYSDNGMGWGYADAYVWRGLTYLNRGDKDKARTDFQAALTIAPNFAWAGTLLEQLDLNVAAY
jgi:tetratricopeptide (TPR) repeat protein